MNFTQLKYFQAVVQEEHITKASQKLSITQPALSKVIIQLENELGVKLFSRVGRKIVLNDYGRVMLKYADSILHDYSAAISRIEQMKRQASNMLNVAVTGLEFSRQIFFHFHLTYPDIFINNLLIREKELTSIAMGENMDFILSSVPVNVPGVKSKEIFEERLMLAVPIDHPLAVRESIHFAEAKDCVFAFMPQEYAFRKMAEDICIKAGFTPNVVLIGYADQLSDIVEEGLAVTLIAESTDKIFKQGVRRLLLEDEFCKRKIYLIWKELENTSKSYIKFRDFVLKEGSNVTLNR